MVEPANTDRPRDRDWLLQLIADAVKRNVTYLDERSCLAVADSVLRNFRGQGLRILDRRRRGR